MFGLFKKSEKDEAPFTIYYHGACKEFTGRAAPIMMILDHAGIKYDIKDVSDAPDNCGFAVPFISFEDGQNLSQTIAITTDLGEKYGLIGKTGKEKTECLQAQLDLNDAFCECIAGKFKENPERLLKWKGVIESRLKDPFFGGKEVSAADYFAVMVFTFINHHFGENYDDFPKIAKWLTSIDEVPVVKKQKESGIEIIPEFMK